MTPPTCPGAPAVLAILGPTAAGKSALGLELAELLGGEILCCDSMQVYRGLDIGTAKPTAAERAAVPHHLLDLADPNQQFHAAAWVAAARDAIADIVARGRLPIIVGGTGLYYRALTQGLFEAPPPDPEIRLRHQAEAAAQGIAALHERLRAVDPQAAAKITSGDLVRISRALEVYEQTGATISELRRRAAVAPPALCVFSILIDVAVDRLRPLISDRVERMMAAGFLDEVRRLRAAGFGAARALAALGYKQLSEHLDGAVSLAEAVARTKLATVAFARRQRTWFRREPILLRAQFTPRPSALAGLIHGYFRVQDARLHLRAEQETLPA